MTEHAADTPLTVGELLAARAATLGDVAFLVTEDESLTYRDAERRSRELARGLLAVGAGRSTRIGVLFPTGSSFVVSWLAAARIGAVTVPISTFSRARELGWLLDHADVGILLATNAYRGHDYVERLADALPDLDLVADGGSPTASAPALRDVFFAAVDGAVPRHRTIDALVSRGSAVSDALLDAVEADVSPADPMVIVHTSGSTSAPKGVVHTHGALIRHLANLNRLRGLGERDTLFSNSPLFWIGGFAYTLLGSLAAGSTLISSASQDAERTLDLIERERPRMVNGYAHSIAHLVEHPSFAGRDLSFIETGNLYPIMPPHLVPADPELRHNLLGLTEAGSVALMDPDERDQPERRRGSFGRPVPQLEARVVDVGTGRDAGTGAVGELWLRGPLLMEGYDGRERHETFTPDEWFATGDLFSVDEDGFFYFKGRRGQMIKTGGANVAPLEVENALRELGLTAIVLGVDDSERGQIVVAVLVAADADSTPDDATVLAGLRERLSSYKVPRRLVRLAPGDVPVLASGKTDLVGLQEMLA